MNAKLLILTSFGRSDGQSIIAAIHKFRAYKSWNWSNDEDVSNVWLCLQFVSLSLVIQFLKLPKRRFCRISGWWLWKLRRDVGFSHICGKNGETWNDTRHIYLYYHKPHQVCIKFCEFQSNRVDTLNRVVREGIWSLIWILDLTEHRCLWRWHLFMFIRIRSPISWILLIFNQIDTFPKCLVAGAAINITVWIHHKSILRSCRGFIIYHSDRNHLAQLAERVISRILTKHWITCAVNESKWKSNISV